MTKGGHGQTNQSHGINRGARDACNYCLCVCVCVCVCVCACMHACVCLNSICVCLRMYMHACTGACTTVRVLGVVHHRCTSTCISYIIRYVCTCTYMYMHARHMHFDEPWYTNTIPVWVGVHVCTNRPQTALSLCYLATYFISCWTLVHINYTWCTVQSEGQWPPLSVTVIMVPDQS